MRVLAQLTHVVRHNLSFGDTSPTCPFCEQPSTGMYGGHWFCSRCQKFTTHLTEAT